MRLKPAMLLLPSLLAATTGQAQSPAPRSVADSAKSAQAACSELARRQHAHDTSLAQLPLTGVDSTCHFGAPPMGLNGAGASMPAMNPQTMAAMAAMVAQLSPEQMAQMRAMMSQMQGGMAGMGSQMSPATPSQSDQGGLPGLPPGMAMPGMSGFGGMESEEPIRLSSDLVHELKKGKAVVHDIGWEPGAGTVASSGSAGFDRAMDQVAVAMKQAGGSYRLDLYMDQQSAKVVVRTLGAQRLATVQSALTRRGVRPELGPVMQDGDPRLEIVRLR